MQNAENNLERNSLELAEPNDIYKKSYIEALKEFREVDNEEIDVEERENNFDGFLAKIDKEKNQPDEGRVPSFQYWGVIGDTYIGRVNYRPVLNDHLRFHGGNIGYAIRPSERGKGYATMLLQMALEKAKQDGLSEVLLTCDTDNIASIKVIERCGGLFKDKAVDEKGIEFNRYTIHL